MTWKRLRHYVLFIVEILLLLVVVGAYIFVHTRAFTRIMVGEIISKAQSRTGANVSIGKMQIHWGELKIDFYNVALRSPSRPEPPLFSCDHLAVGVKILSIWKRKINLDEVILDQPVLRIRIDSKGRANLPRPNIPSSPDSPSDHLFDLGVGHFEINAGQIAYNDEQVPVSAELRDLRTKIRFNRAAQSYEGTLAYDHGRITAASVIPFEHKAQIDFAANRSALNLRSLALSTANTHLSVQAIISDYSRPRIQGSYEAIIFTPDLARILREPSLPNGEVHTRGSFAYDNRSNRPLVDAVSVSGQMDAPEVAIDAGGISARARQVRANYALQSGNLRVQDLSANVLGGALNASFLMSNLADSQPATRLSASVRGGSLSQLTRMAPASPREKVALAGRLDADVEAQWTGTLSNVVAHARASIYGPLTAPARTTIPVNGSLDARYDGAQDTVTFAASTLRTQNTHVAIRGLLSQRSCLSVQADAHDLQEITQIISSLTPQTGKPRSNSSSIIPADLRGSAAFAGQVEGSVRSPRVRGKLMANEVSIAGTNWRSIQGDIDLSASRLSIQNAYLRGQGQTSLTLNGYAGLQNWSPSPGEPLSLRANASGISLTDLQRIAKLRYPVIGILSANIFVHGSENNPAGQASLDVSKASAWGEPVNHLSIRAEGNRNSVHATAQLQAPAGPVLIDLTYAPRSQQYDARVNAPKLALDQVQVLRGRGATVRGVASISANGKGTIDRPQFTAQLEVPQLQIENQAISGLRAQLNVANQRANVTVNSTLAQGYLQAKGDLDLHGDYFANVSLDVRALPLGPLTAAFLPKASHTLQGQTEIHAKLNGPLKQPEEINAQVQIPTLTLAYQSVHFGLAEPMTFSYTNGALSIEKADIRGNGTELSIHGSVPVKSTQPLNVVANAKLDLAMIQDFSPDIKSSGQINLRATAQGSLSKPAMEGQLQIVNAQFSSETSPLSLEGINGRIHASGNRIEIDRLKGTAGGGIISASGFLVYGPHPNFSVSAQAQSIRLRYPEGIRSILDANLDLEGSPGSSSLTGRVLVDQVSFTQQFDMANLMGQLSSETPSTPPSAFERNMKLNVTVATSNELNLTSSKLSMAGSANLTVNGNLADPVILGRISLTQGEIFFMGKRYEIDNGTVAFANPTRTEPVINLYAKTSVQQYNITLNFAGPVDRLRTNYTSDPPLSQSDIINLIAFGKTAEQAATSPSTPPSVGAESVLAQGVSSQVSGKLEKLAGISQLTLDPLATNSQSNPGAQVAIQQRVSGSLLLTFSTDVTSTQAQTVEVQYKPSKKWTISVIRDQNGGYGIDARIHKVF